MKVTVLSKGASIADHVAVNSQFDWMLDAKELNITYEDNPLHLESDKFLSVRMDQAYIMPNLDSIITIAGKFQKAMVQEYNLTAYYDEASDAANEYIKSGQDYVAEMATGNYEHKTMEMHINIKAPTIIIPYDASNLNEAMIVIDMGKIQLSSENAQRSQDQEWLKTTTDEKYLYDKYRMKCIGMTIQTIWSCQSPCHWMDGEKESILNEFSFNETLYNCVTKENNQVATIKLDGNIPKLEWHISDNQIAFLMKFNDHLQETMKSQMPPPNENPEPEKVQEEEFEPYMTGEEHQ